MTSGVARGRRLKSPPPGVRPTSDLVRGAMFDVLGEQDVDDARVLDLYAGSGALGIEALSRGARWCDFVERVTSTMNVIRENLDLTGLQEKARVHRVAVERAQARLKGPYTLVFADPPYDDEKAMPALEAIAGSDLVAPGATLVLEHSRRRTPPSGLGPLHLDWTRRYGDSQVSIYRDSGLAAGQSKEELQ